MHERLRDLLPFHEYGGRRPIDIGQESDEATGPRHGNGKREDREPLPADSPLWNLDNLLITPHTAGLTDKLWQRHYELFSENLRRHIAGEPLLYVVDKHKGY